jgi:hypothetical protein
MANITINTQSAGYQNMLAEYNTIMTFWKPYIQDFFTLDQQQRQDWRAADPFLDRILTVTKAIVDEREENL